MRIHLWGTDFRRSNSSLREKLYISPDHRKKVLQKIFSLGFQDLVYLHTCNRIEFYTTASDHFVELRPNWIKLLKLLKVSEDDYFRGYALEGKSALRHLLRVAASLESLVIGESQILGQLKNAYDWVKKEGFPLEQPLDKCFQLAFKTAKKIRATTQIAEKPVSIASLAFEKMLCAESIIPIHRVAVIGRGPMSLSILKMFKKRKLLQKVVWVNRSLDALKSYPTFSDIKMLSLDSFLKTAPTISHLLTSTSSKAPLFDEPFLKSLNVSLIFDLAEPPDCILSTKPNKIYYFQMHDLKEEALKNTELRSQSISEAEKIIEQSMRDFLKNTKRGPLLKDFSLVEPLHMSELNSAIKNISQKIPTDYLPELELWAEKLLKKNLHHSKIHLQNILSATTEPKEHDGP